MGRKGRRQARRRANRAPKQQPFIPRLPYEIWSTIFEEVFSSYEGEEDSRTLGSLSMTCRSFSDVARPILFRKLDMRAKYWGNPSKAPSPCSVILSIVQLSLGHMVRVADFCPTSYELSKFVFESQWWTRAVDLDDDRNDSNTYQLETPFHLLLGAMGVGLRTIPCPPRHLDPVIHFDHIRELYRDEDGEAGEDLEHAEADLEAEEIVDAEREREILDTDLVSLSYLTIAMGLAAMPNIIKLRLPIDSGWLRLRKIPTKPKHYPVVLNAGHLGCHVELHQHHFPSLSRLQELELVPYQVTARSQSGGQSRLHADQISWIVQRSPNLRTLRLMGFEGFNGRIENFALPCLNITTLCLIGCDIPIDDICLFLSQLPRLKNFKMARTVEFQIRKIGWTWSTEFAYQDASLVLDALSKASPRIEKVFLGFFVLPSSPVAQQPDPATQEPGIPPETRQILPTSGLRHLKTLGVETDNLRYRYPAVGWDDTNMEDNTKVLANMVRDCPSLESLQIFGAHEFWRSYSSYGYAIPPDPDEHQWCSELNGWLEALGKELQSNKESQLREIKLWYIDYDHYLRRINDVDYLIVTGKMEPPEEYKTRYLNDNMDWRYDDRGPRQRAPVHNIPPLLKLEESGLIELFNSVGVRIVLEKEHGYQKVGDCHMPRDCGREDCPCVLPPIGDMNADESLWWD
ncbi:hypothetical protein V8F20_003881 [Naviculisporaceae sp. PSN 640]